MKPLWIILTCCQTDVIHAKKNRSGSAKNPGRMKLSVDENQRAIALRSLLVSLKASLGGNGSPGTGASGSGRVFWQF